jgi:hypothetical protein
VIVNELAQWAVLLFLAIFVVGLTRQLGFQLQTRSETLDEIGPQVGERVPDALLDEDERGALSRLAAESPAGETTVVVLDQHCLGCKAIVAALETHDGVLPRPAVAFVTASDDAGFMGRVEGAFDLVFSDETGFKADSAGIIGTPFAMTVDRDLNVKRREFVLDPSAFIERWGNGHAGNGRVAAAIEIALHNPAADAPPTSKGVMS